VKGWNIRGKGKNIKNCVREKKENDKWKEKGKRSEERE